MSDKGVVYVAFGEAAINESCLSRASLEATNPDLPVCVIGMYAPADMSDKEASRYAKVNMLAKIPSNWRECVYLDADTRVYGDLSPGFDALAAGFDIVIAPSDHQGGDAFWHIGDEEREITYRELGFQPLQLQCGVMFVANNRETRRFYQAWYEEWKRWRDEDQAAFVRALNRCPVKVALLGKPWNGGTLIGHRFGMARQ